VNKHVYGFRSKVGELQLIILTRPPLEHAPTSPAGVGKHVVLVGLPPGFMLAVYLSSACREMETELEGSRTMFDICVAGGGNL
jgi:hypothetical protein